MKKKFIVILVMSLLVYGRSAYAVFDIAACIESVLEFKTEIEHKIEEVQKKLKDIESTMRQGFDTGTNCFKNPLKCNPQEMMRFLSYANEDSQGRQKSFGSWGFGMNNVMDSLDANDGQEGYMKGIETGYTYNRGQGEDLKNVSKNREDVNKVVYQEIALLFAKGAATHNDIQQENDSVLYDSEFNNNNIDEILKAQTNVALMTATRLARVLELRSNIISSAATAELTLQNQENLSTSD